MPSICLRRIHVKQLHISCLHNLAVQWCSRRKQRLSCPVQQEGKRKLVAWGREGGRERGREGGRLPFPSSLPHAFFAFLHSQFLCSVPFKPISHRLTRQLKKYESFHIFPFILQTHNTCSPVGLVSLMDRVLCPVIAKVRVRFLVKSDFFMFFFNRLGCLFHCEDLFYFHETSGVSPLLLSCLNISWSRLQCSHCLPVVLHQSFNHNFLRGLGIRNKALNYSSISRRVKCWMIHSWKKYIIIFTAVLLCILLVRNSLETL